MMQPLACRPEAAERNEAAHKKPLGIPIRFSGRSVGAECGSWQLTGKLSWHVLSAEIREHGPRDC